MKVRGAGKEDKPAQAVKLFAPGTDADVIAAWRSNQRVELKKNKPAPGTLAEDIDRHLRMRSTMPPSSTARAR